MESSDFNVLLDMGFEKERAELAVQKSGGLQGALEWLEQNQDKSLDDIKAPLTETNDEDDPSAEPPALRVGEVAKSLVCNECGKKFRSQAQAEFHASKTYVELRQRCSLFLRMHSLTSSYTFREHVDFAESEEEIAPLTEEEKKARLEDLRLKLAEKRAGLSEQDKEDKRRNEAIRRKSTKETQDAKEDLKKNQQIKEAAAKRREKQEEVAAKQRIKDKIAADKEERRLRTEKEKAEREGRALPVAPVAAPMPTTSGPVASKPASAYTETRLRLQTPSGTIQKSFPVDLTLFEVASAIGQESGTEVQSFTQNYPKKVFGPTEFGQTLKEAGLVPSAALIVR
ncbi:MAG: hypothetical protein M1827_002909 [Pycnora praestabilis]|nr:MAG: hypothetical protein M1827_002909 [Pycnora praestabilis]